MTEESWLADLGGYRVTGLLGIIITHHGAAYEPTSMRGWDI